ncbi:hypothetical protein HK105_201617 [Polyrhizophydium stewartii]|uniref:DUF155 domain-containing protein n=1 Tax=Polyrhizophydium stewartii TaxID=2732419 RepID=A0ABR4NGX4_9FUNG
MVALASAARPAAGSLWPARAPLPAARFASSTSTGDHTSRPAVTRGPLLPARDAAAPHPPAIPRLAPLPLLAGRRLQSSATAAAAQDAVADAAGASADAAAATADAAPADAAGTRRAVPAKKKKGVRDVRSDDDVAPVPPGMVSAPTPEPLRVTAFCTAEKYDQAKLFRLLGGHYTVLPYMADEIFHVSLAEKRASADAAPAKPASGGTQTAEGVSVTVADPEAAECFFFTNGTFVTWGATDAQNERLLNLVRRCEDGRYATAETEWFDYFTDMTQPGGIASDVIILGNELPTEQAKLAYSAGLSRSVKLASLEVLLEQHLNKSRDIPGILLRGKRLPIGRAAIMRNLGELFSLRANVNLNSELLDSPDFCWSSRRMEEYFSRISHNLDVSPRIAIFNKKLDYANEVAEVLRNHLHEQHSLKLEWCIIILISVEICFECVHFLAR